MSEKLAEVFEQYDMEILGTKKGRGATILQTSEGVRILEPFRGNVTRLEQEYVLKRLFREEGCSNLDELIPNRDGLLLTCDKYRQPYVMKAHFEGNECDMRSRSDILRSVAALAQFHVYGRKVAPRFREAWAKDREEKERRKVEEIRRAILDGEELERIACVYEVSQSALEAALEGEPEGRERTLTEPLREEESGREIPDIFRRHNRELKKIRRFVSGVKRKNDFENLFLQVFDTFYSQGVTCVELLDAAGGRCEEPAQAHGADGGSEETFRPDSGGRQGAAGREKCLDPHYGICHGSFNQHNVLLWDGGEAIVHFERFSRGCQLHDLYQFARKVMEKNHFDFRLLKDVFGVYGNRIPLSAEDYRYMYILFSYPEKFWKIANGYYNAGKAFLSPKYVEKLRTVICQENEKRRMLGEYSAFQERKY